VDKCGTNGCGIPAGASFSDATVMTVHPETPPGTYYVGGIVDNNNYVLESNENNNNIVYAGSKVTVVRNVDLIVTAVSTVASATRGTTINIPVSIKNQGTTVASTGNSYATVYLSKDATINNADWNLGRVIYGGYLAAGATASGTLTVTLPTAAIGLAAGTYYIGAFVDAELAQPETNETNNAKAGNTIIIN
jgi:subtilase family serine protease